MKRSGAALALATIVALGVTVGVAAYSAAAPSASTLVEDRAQAYAITLPRGWSPIAAPGTLRALRSTEGAILVVNRIDAGQVVFGKGPDVADAFERGVRRETPGYRREARSQRAVGYAAVIDLTYRRDRAGLELVTTRFIVLRSRTLVLSIGAPATASRATRRAIADAAKSFAPLLD